MYRFQLTSYLSKSPAYVHGDRCELGGDPTPFTAFADDVRLVRLWCFSDAILKCDIKMNSGLNDNSGIHFVDKENMIIDSNIVQIQPYVPKWNHFRFSGAVLNF